MPPPARMQLGQLCCRRDSVWPSPGPTLGLEREPWAGAAAPARGVHSPWHLYSSEGWDSHHHKLRQKMKEKQPNFSETKIIISLPYIAYENVLKNHEKRSFKTTTDIAMCTLQELFYTAPLLEKVLVTTLSLKDLTTLTTTSHWKWLACLGIRKTRRYYRFWCKNPLPEHFQVTKDSTGSALLRISWGTKYLRADFHVFPIRPYTASQKCALQTLACQSFVLTNTFLFCWHKQATCSYLFCALVSVRKI